MARTLGRIAHLLLCGSCVLGGLPGVGPARAFAQEPAREPTSDARSRVDELLAHGIQSREAGRDAEALEYYRQASALDPDNPRVLAHLGATYHALGRWVSAHTYLSRALEHRDDPYIARHHAELEEALDTVGEHIGFLEVYGAPDGAEALLNGQVVATMPMTKPVPVIVGSYQLEVRLAGHYALGRPIKIAQRGLTREEVELAPQHMSAAGPAAAALPEATEPSGGPTWLPWVLGGLSAAATATTLVAWQQREYYADRWNDDAACVGVGVSREERCGSELDRGKRAETVLWISGVAAGVFAAGAVLTAIWVSGDEPREASFQCAPGLGGAGCFGTF